MATLHHLDWLFAIGVIFFLMSAWGIGTYMASLSQLRFR